MNRLRCKAGDLAVVINADYSANLGRIVRIMKQDDGRGDLRFAADIPTWVVESAHPLSWYVGKKRFKRKSGPVPDAYLHPIRGYPEPRDIAEGLCDLEPWPGQRLSAGDIEKLF